MGKKLTSLSHSDSMQKRRLIKFHDIPQSILHFHLKDMSSGTITGFKTFTILHWRLNNIQQLVVFYFFLTVFGFTDFFSGFFLFFNEFLTSFKPSAAIFNCLFIIFIDSS